MKVFKIHVGDLKMYDCRTCWAVFTEHNAFTFFSYNCCDKSVFKSIVTCEKEQRLWPDFKFVTSHCSGVSGCEFCLQMFCLWPAKAHSHFRKSTKRTLFFQRHRQRPGMCHPEGKCDCSDQCCCDTHKKNIVSMLVYKIYNRFILVC